MVTLEQQSDPTQDEDLVLETQTVTASDGTVDVTFDEDFSSTPIVLATAKHSEETGVTVEDGTVDVSGCTVLAENDVDVDVLVIGK